MKKFAIAALALLVCLPLFASGRPRPGDDGPSLHFRLAFSDTTPGGTGTDRQIQVLSLDQGRSRVSTGWRIPFLTMAPAGAQTADRPPLSAVSYQDVGVEVTLHARSLAGGKVRTSGEFEMSAVDPDEKLVTVAGAAPRVGTFKYVFDVLLDPDVETVLAEVPNPKGGSTRLTIVASVQR